MKYTKNQQLVIFMKVEIFEGNWDINLVKSNPQKIWIFGDNDQRIGNGGQAIIRNLSNTIGIRTKKAPSNSQSSFYSDDEYEINCQKIFEDLILIKSKLIEGYDIVFSKNGYGTGLALLKEKAPRTFLYLCDSLKSIFGFDNETGNKWQRLPSINEIENGIYIQYHKQNDDLLIPINNSLFLDSLLQSNINNYFDAIKLEKKVSLSSKTSYKKGDILLISFPGKKDYIVVKVLEDSYKIENLDIWSLLEGFKYDFISMDISKYKQTIFSYVCQLSEDGNMIFRDDIFSTETPKHFNNDNIEEVKDSENILNDILNQLKEINKKLDNLNK